MRGFACIGLDNPKTRLNVGSAIRAAGVYNASMIAISGRRYKTSPTDTMNQYKQLPIIQTSNLQLVIPFSCVPVAVDFVENAVSLPEYKHPERAFYIFGAEDATLGKRILSFCKDRIFIPTKGCMNLAATVNVILYDRMCKELRKRKEL